MNFKEYVETKYKLTLDEPYSYYNVQWMSWAEEYAEYKQGNVGMYDDVQETKEQLHIKHKIPFNIDPVKALEYGKCNFCGKWYGDCKGH